jgi:hypothetical protein
MPQRDRRIARIAGAATTSTKRPAPPISTVSSMPSPGEIAAVKKDKNATRPIELIARVIVPTNYQAPGRQDTRIQCSVLCARQMR